MSLGTGALKISRVPDAIVAGRYPWQPWNALKISGNNLAEKIPWPPNAKEGERRFTMTKLLIRKDQLM